MEIVYSIDFESWESFIKSHPRGNIFQSPQMYQLYGKSKNHEPILVAAIDKKQNILGILMSVIQKEYSGILGKLTSRSIVWGGPVIKNNDPAILNFILKEYAKEVKSKSIYSQFRNLWDWEELEKKVFEKNDLSYEEHLDILIDLNKEVDQLLMEMHKGRRKNIRRAERIPLEFNEVNNEGELIQCINLINDTYTRVKLPSPDIEYFQNAIAYFGRSKLKVFAVKFENIIISCRFELCYNNLIYDWFAGTNEEYLDKYPNDYLPWKIMLWAKKKGYRTFDFGGAGKPNIPYGVRDYKIKFGGELVEYGRFKKIHKPILFKFAKIGLFFWQKIV